MNSKMLPPKHWEHNINADHINQQDMKIKSYKTSFKIGLKKKRKIRNFVPKHTQKYKTRFVCKLLIT